MNSSVYHVSLRRASVLALALGGVSVLGQTPPQAQQASEHARRAQQFLSEKKPELAIPELRALTELDPANIDAQGNLGVLLFFKGDYAGAIPPLGVAVDARPDLARIQALLGISQKRTGDLKDAATNLEAAFPKLDEARFRTQAGLELVETDAALGLPGKAAEVLDQLRMSDPENPQVLSTAYQIYSQLMSETLLDLVVAAPESAEVHFIMGQNMAREGNNSGALAQYRKALAINPGLPGLHFALADLLHSSSDPALRSQAEGEYQAALKVNAFDEKSLCGAGEIEADKGSLKDAQADYEKALELQPNDPEAETGLAKVLAGENENAKAIALLKHALERDPTNIVAHYRLSTLYRQAGKTEEAKRELAAYEHYKDVKSKLDDTFKQMRTPSPEQAATAAAPVKN